MMDQQKIMIDEGWSDGTLDGMKDESYRDANANTHTHKHAHAHARTLNVRAQSHIHSLKRER